MRKIPLSHSLGMSIFVALSSCASPQKITQEYANLTCADLLRELGRTEGIEEYAKNDEIVAGFDLIIANDDADYAAAGVEAIIASSSKKDALTRQDILRDQLVSKGCRY